MISAREAMFMEGIERLGAMLDHAVKSKEAGEPYDGIGEEIARTVSSLVSYTRHVREAEGIPDDMAPGWNRPAPASTEALVALLEDAAQRVAIGDSFEGTITWVMPTDEPELQGQDFGLIARYRIGNLDGQGGLRVYSVPTDAGA